MSERTPRPDVLAELAPMRRYALSLTRDPDAADDLVHDALVKAIERREQFRKGRNLRGWLLSILHNAFLDRRRAARTRDLYHRDHGHRAVDAMPPPQEEAVRFAEMRRAFDALPEEQRAALHLVTIEGLSYEAAAEALAIPVGTLVSRISRARARLRAAEDGDAGSNVVRFQQTGVRDDAGR